jgi:chemotaxis response regulator CheB
MPRAAFEAGAVETQVPLHMMAAKILAAASCPPIGVA